MAAAHGLITAQGLLRVTGFELSCGLMGFGGQRLSNSTATGSACSGSSANSRPEQRRKSAFSGDGLQLTSSARDNKKAGTCTADGRDRRVPKSAGVAARGSVPWRQRQLLILVRVVDGGLDVQHDGVRACSSGRASPCGSGNSWPAALPLPVILAGTVMDMTVNTEYLQRRGRERECGGESARGGVGG